MLLLLCAGEAASDAAVKAQEGSIDHWIEYYARERAQQRAIKATAPPQSPQKEIEDKAVNRQGVDKKE